MVLSKSDAQNQMQSSKDSIQDSRACPMLALRFAKCESHWSPHSSGMISESFWWSSIQWHRIDWWLIVISITLNQCLLIKKIQKLSTLEPKSESDWPEFVITDQSLNLKISDESQQSKQGATTQASHCEVYSMKFAQATSRSEQLFSLH